MIYLMSWELKKLNFRGVPTLRVNARENLQNHGLSNSWGYSDLPKNLIESV